MGLAFADRNPFLDMMRSALQAFNSALDGIAVYLWTVTKSYTCASTGCANADANTDPLTGGLFCSRPGERLSSSARPSQKLTQLVIATDPL